MPLSNLQVTASGVNAELQSSNTLNGVPLAKLTKDVEMGADEEEEDEDAFHDDLPDITSKQKRYLIQKYATLWFNKIKPGKHVVYEEQLVSMSMSITMSMSMVASQLKLKSRSLW